jgi:hypothetical protein
MADDFIGRVARIAERRRASDEKERTWTLHVAETLKSGSEKTFAHIADALVKDIGRVKREWGVTMNLVERTPLSLTIRKEELPGVRIMLDMDRSGRQLHITETPMRSALDRSEPHRSSIELSLDSKGHLHFTDGDEKLIHVKDICERVLKSIAETIGVSEDTWRLEAACTFSRGGVRTESYTNSRTVASVIDLGNQSSPLPQLLPRLDELLDRARTRQALFAQTAPALGGRRDLGSQIRAKRLWR